MDGSHGISDQVRADCTGEVAMSLALGAMVTGNDSWRGIATNLIDLLYFESVASRGHGWTRRSGLRPDRRGLDGGFRCVLRR